MTKKSKALFSLLCYFSLSFIIIEAHAQGASTQVLLRKGHVETKIGDKLWIPVNRKSQLTNNMWIRTKTNSSGILSFSDGSEIKMDENTVLLVENTGAGAQSVVVAKGTILAKIKGAGFKVSSPRANGLVKSDSFFFLAVLGNVERRLSTIYYAKEGQLEVTNKDTKEVMEVRLEQPLVLMNQVNWSTDLKFPLTDIKHMEFYFDKGKAFDEKIKQAKAKLIAELDQIKKELKNSKAQNNTLKTQSQKERERIQKDLARVRNDSQKQIASARAQSQKQMASSSRQAQQQLARQREQYQKQIASLRKQIEELNKKKSASTSQPGPRVDNTKNLLADIKRLKDRENTLNKEITRLKSKISDLEREIASNSSSNKTMTNMQSQIASLKNDIKSLEDKKAKLKKEIENSENLNKEITQLINKKSDLESEIARLKQEKDTLTVTEPVIKETPKAKVTITRVQIANILVGRDRPKVESVSPSQALSFVMTIASPAWYRAGSMTLHAKDVSTGQSYLIYQVNPFHLNVNWAEDQFSWTGTYLDNGVITRLPAGKYYILCTIEARHYRTQRVRTISRFWGYGVRAYYVTVKE